MVVVAAFAAAPASAARAGEARISNATIALLPSAVGTELLAEQGMAVGLLSAGHGIRPPPQTFLDISQGARVSDSLYESDLPEEIRIGPRGVARRQWSRILERAQSAPSRVVPGLLAAALGELTIAAEPGAGLGQLVAVQPSGRIARGAASVRVVAASADELPSLIERAGPRQLLIVLAAPKVRGQRLIPTGFAGAGYGGVLRSRTTRLDGLISAIDLAPTLLELLGKPIPEAVDGRFVGVGTGIDPGEVRELRDRLLELSPRRTPVVWLNTGIFVLLAALASLIGGRRGRALALPWLAVTMAALPGLLLVGAAIQPSELAERLIVGLGSPAVGWILLRWTGGFGAFALAAAASVGAYAIDVIAGSPLTALTVGGSNPSSGVRYFGIGNEHEAALSALTLTGTGAALAAWAPRLRPRGGAAVFVAVAGAGVLAFAPGRFGADVGMAITLPVGAAVAVAVILEASRRGWALVLAAPVAGVAALVAVDLITGGDAHLSRSVLDAEDAGDVAGVFEARLRLAWGSLERNAESPFLWAALALLAFAIYRRAAVRSALAAGPRPALAGLAGAGAAVVAGTLANDSGITLFVIGIWFAIPFAGLIGRGLARDNR